MRIRNIYVPGGETPPLHSQSEQNDKLQFKIPKEKNQAPRLGRPVLVQPPALAAAAIVVTAVVIVGVATAATAVAEDQQKDNDPPPVVTTEAIADTVIVAHKNTSKNFVELCCPHSML